MTSAAIYNLKFSFIFSGFLSRKVAIETSFCGPKPIAPPVRNNSVFIPCHFFSCEQTGVAAKHRGSVRASHPEAPDSNLGAPDFLTIEISSAASRKCCLEKWTATEQKKSCEQTVRWLNQSQMKLTVNHLLDKSNAGSSSSRSCRAICSPDGVPKVLIMLPFAWGMCCKNLWISCSCM